MKESTLFISFPWLLVVLILATGGRLSGWGADLKEPEMVLIPAGSFLFGPTEKEKERVWVLPTEATPQTILSATFFIGKYPVTNEEYAVFMEEGGYREAGLWSADGWSWKERLGWTEPRRWRDPDYNGPGKERYPACALSWYEADAFCRWLAQRTGRRYRLPTEREWEKAARGEDGRIFPWGDEWNPKACNWLADTDGDRLPNMEEDRYIRTAPVDAYEAGKSPYGCYEMAGNVLEWCADAWSGEPSSRHAGEVRVFRGGCFLSGEPRQLRCSWRGGTFAEIGHVYWGIIGFRVAQDVP